MGRTDYPGIDYSLGQANRDRDTGISYGVINANQLLPYIWDEAEAEYAKSCPHCAEELGDDYEGGAPCPHCGKDIEDGEEYGEDPLCWNINTDGIIGMIGRDGDLFVFKSPVAIHAQFCSPCAPGAGHLACPCQHGPLTYALPLDWFDDEYRPYEEEDIINVATG